MNTNKKTARNLALLALIALSMLISACGSDLGTIVNDTSSCPTGGSASPVIDGCPSTTQREVSHAICTATGGTVGADGKCH